VTSLIPKYLNFRNIFSDPQEVKKSRTLLDAQFQKARFSDINLQIASNIQVPVGGDKILSKTMP
jgi:hypothetical protein